MFPIPLRNFPPHPPPKKKKYTCTHATAHGYIIFSGQNSDRAVVPRTMATFWLGRCCAVRTRSAAGFARRFWLASFFGGGTDAVVILLPTQVMHLRKLPQIYYRAVLNFHDTAPVHILIPKRWTWIILDHQLLGLEAALAVAF